MRIKVSEETHSSSSASRHFVNVMMMSLGRMEITEKERRGVVVEVARREKFTFLHELCIIKLRIFN